LGLVLVTLLGGCAAEAPPPPPPPPPAPALVEENLDPPARAQVAILDLDEEIQADGQTVVVTGKLINRGSRPSRGILVRVQALDAEGRVVVEAETDANPGSIAPGSTGSFQAILEHRPGIQDYHVEVLYRP